MSFKLSRQAPAGAQPNSSTPTRPNRQGVPLGGNQPFVEVRELAELRREHLNLTLQARAILDPQSGASGRETRAQELAPKLVALGERAEVKAEQANALATFFGANHISLGAQKLLEALAKAHQTSQRHSYRNKSLAELKRFEAQLPQSALVKSAQLVQQTQEDTDDAHQTSHASLLTLGDGHIFRLGPEIFERQGSFGQVHRIELLTQRPLQKLLVKVQRSADTVYAGEQNAKTMTFSQNLSEMVARAELSSAATQRIEKALNDLFSSRKKDARAARNLGFERGSVKMIDHFVDEFGRYFQVMHAMSDDLVELSTSTLSMQRELGLGKQTILDLRLSVATQSILQIAAMHRAKVFSRTEKGLMHNDIKLSNMVFNGFGALRLIDFDEVARLSILSGSQTPFKKAGTLTSPEMELASLRRRNDRLDAAHDVFAWGASMLDFALEAGHNTLFVMGQLAEQKKHTPAFAMATYVAWFERFVPQKKPIAWPLDTPRESEIDALSARAQSLLNEKTKQATDDFKRQVKNLAHDYTRMFNARGEQDPHLGALLLQSALHPHRGRRKSANLLSRALLKRLSRLDEVRRQTVVDYMDTVAKAGVSDD